MLGLICMNPARSDKGTTGAAFHAVQRGLRNALIFAERGENFKHLANGFFAAATAAGGSFTQSAAIFHSGTRRKSSASSSILPLGLRMQ
jgi:hypothetical protein